MTRARVRKMPPGEPILTYERNVTLYTYGMGRSFCGYRAAMQHKGVKYCRYFSAKSMGWQGAHDAAVEHAKAWRKAFGKEVQA